MNPEKIQTLLAQWLSSRLKPESMQWLREKAAALKADASGKAFFAIFSAAARHAGKETLALSATDLAFAQDLVPGWNPANWTCIEAARAHILLALPYEPAENYARILDQALETADLGETLALQKSLPLLPHPLKHYDRACLGARSNMKAVFEAVALDNPFPARYFDEGAWNQLVLKAIFVEAPLRRIYGIDERANPILARMLVDYAHERWAAGRVITPELWRSVGPFADKSMLEDLQKVVETGTLPEKRAGALALKACPLPEAQSLLSAQGAWVKEVEEGSINWENLES